MREERVPECKGEDKKKIQREKVVEREEGKACLTVASCSTELQFDTQTSVVSEHVSWVKWLQIPLRQAEMYM